MTTATNDAEGLSASNGMLSKDHVFVWDGPADILGPSIYGLGDTTKFFYSDNMMCMWMTSTTPYDIITDKLKNYKKVVWDLTTTRWVRKKFNSPGYGGGDDIEHIGWFKEDSWSVGRKSESKDEARKVGQLSRSNPNIAGGILDYSFSGFASRGGTPDELKDIYEALKADNDSLKLYWMVYTTDLDAKWAAYLPYLDVLSLWEPKRANLVNLDETINKCAIAFPTKPILLGLYIVDYWAKKLEPGEDHKWKWHSQWALEPMPMDLLEFQFTKAVQYIKEGKIIGFQILAESVVDKFPQTTGWVRKFLHHQGLDSA